MEMVITINADARNTVLNKAATRALTMRGPLHYWDVPRSPSRSQIRTTRATSHR